MTPLAIGACTFASIFAGTVGGGFVRGSLPEDHLSQDSKDVIMLGMGLLGTTAALVLGLPIVLVFWVTVIFASFGLFAPRNPTVIAVLLVCALSIAASIFLIIEMDRPFGGLMRIPSAPLRYTLAHLGQ